MKKSLIINKDGSRYFSFSYYDCESKTIKHLSQEYITARFGHRITSNKEAEEVISILEESIISKKSKVAKRLIWEGNNSNLKEYLDLYTAWHKKKAPNSWEDNFNMLRQYVFYYFNSIIEQSDINQWSNYYEEFKEWLEDEARLIIDPKKKISYSRKNHAIRALNSFMKFMHFKRVLKEFYLCEQFPGYKVGRRSVDDIISNEEFNAIYNRLKAKGYEQEATLYRLGYYSAMRFNEMIGISLADVFDGRIENEGFGKILRDNELDDYIGYLVIDSQPAHAKGTIRGKDGTVPRKPLKGRREIDERHAKTIVIHDKVLWGELTELYNQKIQRYHAREYGDDLKNYLIFDHVHRSKSSTRLKKMYMDLGLNYKSWHCLRHTRATLLIGKTGDHRLCRIWLEHVSDKVLERYNHLYQAVVRSAKQRKTIITKLK